jgi:hypothetical protein
MRNRPGREKHQKQDDAEDEGEIQNAFGRFKRWMERGDDQLARRSFST